MIDVAAFFKDQEHLHQALIHRSYCNEHPGTRSNERLEFLGDSVLSLVISHRLFLLFPDTPEGDLTGRRSHLVQTTTLAAKSKILHFDEWLLLSKGEEDSGGRQNVSLLANTFEAVLGAMFLDAGLNVCYDYLTQVFTDSELLADIQIKDPKSLLQELSQAKGWGTPNYHIIKSIGPDHAKQFVIAVDVNGTSVATGQGTSKQRGETSAAVAALEKLFPDAKIASDSF